MQNNNEKLIRILCWRDVGWENGARADIHDAKDCFTICPVKSQAPYHDHGTMARLLNIFATSTYYKHCLSA